MEFINNGDDCVCIMDRHNMDHFRDGLHEWFMELGFNMVLEDPVYIFERINFCQANPIWTPNGHIMVRHPSRGLAKDAMSTIDVSNPGAFYKYLWARGTCGIACTGGIPVYQNLYDLYIRSGVPGNVQERYDFRSGLFFASRRMSLTRQSVHPMTRVSFWEAFGYTPDEQIQCEEWFDSQGRLRFSTPAPILTNEQRIQFSLPSELLTGEGQ